MRFLHSPEEITAAMMACIHGKRDPVVAVAFWGSGAVEALGLNRVRRAVRVLVNAETGGSNPDELDRLRRCRYVTVKSCSKLHAKVAICSNSMVVGSANASANGLGLEGSELTGWREAVVRVNDPQQIEDAKEWFESLWTNNEAVTLDDAIIKRARVLRARYRQSAIPVRQLLSATPEPDVPDGRRIYIVLTNKDNELEIADVRNAAAGLGITLPPGYCHFEDWSDIPIGAVLLSFLKSDGEIHNDGVWETPSKSFKISIGSVDAYPVARVSQARCKELGFGNLNEWIPSVEAMSKKLWRKANRTHLIGDESSYIETGGDWCIRLSDYLRFCHNQGLVLPPI